MMLESMAIGIPVICTDCPVGGARMFINSGENGLLIPVGDYKALANAMKSYLENEDFARKVSIAEQKITDRLRNDIIFGKWEELI